METLRIQILNPKVMGLIRELEKLELITVIKETNQPTQRLSDKYIGKLPVEIANDMQEFVKKGRTEWG